MCFSSQVGLVQMHLVHFWRPLFSTACRSVAAPVVSWLQRRKKFAVEDCASKALLMLLLMQLGSYASLSRSPSSALLPFFFLGGGEALLK